MSRVITSSSVVLAQGLERQDNNSPFFGYENLVTTGNITATTEDVDHPAINLANPSTASYWRGDSGSPAGYTYLTTTINRVDPVDYLAVAKHNFGTLGIPICVEGLSNSDGSPLDWFELTSEVILADDSPLVFRFEAQTLYAVRLRILPNEASSSPPQIAVMYVGKLLIMPCHVYVGHTPINLGRDVEATSGFSENGNFLGRIILRESRSTSFDFQNLPPAWYRTYFDPFVVASKTIPFFFAWRPQSYPYECGFGWVTSIPKPTNQRANGMMQVAVSLKGVA